MRNNRTIMKDTLQLLENRDTLLVVDTETTGLKKDSEIIQFSGITYHINQNGTLTECSRINYYINPKQQVPLKVQRITGLNNQFLERADMEEIVFLEINKYIQDAFEKNALIAGYCVDFDLRMIRTMYERQGSHFPEFVSLDIKKIAKDILLEDDLKDYKLQTCITHLGLDAGIRFHSAIDDVYATGLLFEYCIKNYLQQLVKRNSSIETKLISANYFVNPMQKSMKRIIVQTSLGEVYYDVVKRGWGVKKQSEMTKSTFEQLDLDKLEKDLLKKYRYSSMDTLIRVLEGIVGKQN